MLDPAACNQLLVYGGAFDPPHRAHIELPVRAAERVGADGVLYVPTGTPPHKEQSTAPAADRLRMLELALERRPEARICTDELGRPGPSYMADTLQRLRDRFGCENGGPALRLLIGADMAAMFYRWRAPRRIIELAEPLVMMRPPYTTDRLLEELPAELTDAERAAWRDRLIDVGRIEVSSTALRQALEAGRYDDPAARGALPAAVLDYIRRRDLYRTR